MAEWLFSFYPLYIILFSKTCWQCEGVGGGGGEKSHSWQWRKPIPESSGEGRNYRAFKLIPKAAIAVCIVLFFITFGWCERAGLFSPLLQIKSGVHYWMMRLFIAVKWVNHEGAPFFFQGREKKD